MMMKSSDKGTNYANVFDFGNHPNDDNITLQLFENNINNHFSIFMIENNIKQHLCYVIYN
jgi:hypothetical protein